MHQTFKANDSVSVSISTRVCGDVRLNLSHPHFDIGRADMRPEVALEIAQALLKAGAQGAIVQFSTAGEGHAEKLKPKRDGSDPAPGKSCDDRFECMDKGCQRGNCWGTSFTHMQSATMPDRDTGAGAQVEPPQRAWPVPRGHSGRVPWMMLAVFASPVALWAGASALVWLGTGCAP